MGGILTDAFIIILIVHPPDLKSRNSEMPPQIKSDFGDFAWFMCVQYVLRRQRCSGPVSQVEGVSPYLSDSNQTKRLCI